MKENVMRLMTLGKIPNDNDMTNELFDQYDKLIQMEHALTYEEAEVLIKLFSDD